MFNSMAITKIQAIVLVTIVIFAAIGAVIVYVLLGDQGQSNETIKIGICLDTDNFTGKVSLQAAILAAEQINAEGGVLGRNFEIIAEDNDGETPPYDVAFATNALIRLITVDEVDFVFWSGSFSHLMIQEYAAEHKKIIFASLGTGNDEATHRVLEDYDKYKYYFYEGSNITSSLWGTVDSFLKCREYTGFNKVGFVYNTIYGAEDFINEVIEELTEYDFEIVHNAFIPADAIDFSSYFAQAEDAGTEILYPFIFGTAGIPFVKEYYERHSPMILWGMIMMAQQSDFWEITEGKCEHSTNNGAPIVAGYPFTNKTLSARDDYQERWNEEITSAGGAMYDNIRFVLPAAINLAGTTETNAVIEALETIEIETSQRRQFTYASNHEILVKMSALGVICMFQWQNGVQVPVWPKHIMEEAGASYTFPDWAGPWDELD